jgi:non-ribosomal peptide synthetase-like protein
MPDHPAIFELGDNGAAPRKTSYGELARAACRLARHLIEHGVKPGDRVLMALPRGADAICAQIAILAAGGAFVPVDVSAPLDRLAFIAADAKARLALSVGAKAAEIAALGLPVVNLELGRENIALQSPEVLPCFDPNDGEAVAYVIYTSGTTGKPKGVGVRHRNACHFVAAEGSILKLTATDQVFHWFSYAFDMSIEEIWPALAAGATLVAATEAIAKSGPDVINAVIAGGVTVWHAVPSLIGMIDRDPPLLRLLNVGGEACPPELVDRWWRPNRRILNTYGPTETTVTATYAELKPGEPVTIGFPLRGYETYVLNGELEPVADGEDGELCIAGGGVSVGYINRPDLTAEKFLLADVGAADGRARLVYRTGDLVRRDPQGRLVFRGRIDTQVKIRGYRVELGEIEHVIREDASIRAAAVVLHQSETAGELLVAYLVLAAGIDIDQAALRQRLYASLPNYMVPTVLEVLPSMPTSASGKIDRKRLPPPREAGDRSADRVAPRNDGERDIAAACAEILGRDDVSVEADFFDELGGHSLRAGRFVSKLRADARYAHVSMGDVYRCRTVARLAAHLAGVDSLASTPAPAFAPASHWRYLLCSAGQTVVLAIFFGLFAFGWLLPYGVYGATRLEGAGGAEAVTAGLGGSMLMALFGAALPILVRALFVGRLRPGAYPMWGLTYFRWWMFHRSLSYAPVELLAGTPFMAAYLRLLGAKIGRGVLVATPTIDIPDLLEIGDGATIGSGSVLSVSAVEAGMLHLGRINIGVGATVGISASVGRGAVIGRNAIVDDLTLIANNCVLRDGEVWSGSPGRPQLHSVGDTERAAPRPASLAMSTAFAAAAASLLLLPFFAVAPGLGFLIAMGPDLTTYFLLTPPLALSYVLSMVGLVAAAKWLVLGRVGPRSAAYWSTFHLRLWIVQTIGELALGFLHPLYGTLYLRPFYRLLGMRYGRGAEVATASNIVHDLVTIGEKSFIADGAMLGAPRFASGTVTVGETTIGRRSFVGNAAVIPQRSVLGDGGLIGVLSRPPASRLDQIRTGMSWFGSPAIFLPQRQKSPPFAEGVTFDPPARLVAQRLVVESVRILLPIVVVAILTIALIDAFLAAWEAGWTFLSLIALLPAAGFGFGVASFAFVAALKWILAGRYRPVVAPLWSPFVWLTELVTTLYEYLAAPFLMGLRGTPYLAIFLRLLGAKIGRRTFIDTVDFTEFDLVSIGDDAALNHNCGPQTHLFEDRVMKLGRVEIGARSTIGSGSIVLYDTSVGAEAMVGDLSIVMKGEVVPPGTSWEGSPARPAAVQSGGGGAVAGAAGQTDVA